MLNHFRVQIHFQIFSFFDFFRLSFWLDNLIFLSQLFLSFGHPLLRLCLTFFLFFLILKFIFIKQCFGISIPLCQHIHSYFSIVFGFSVIFQIQMIKTNLFFNISKNLSFRRCDVLTTMLELQIINHPFFQKSVDWLFSTNCMIVRAFKSWVMCKMQVLFILLLIIFKTQVTEYILTFIALKRVHRYILTNLTFNWDWWEMILLVQIFYF